KYLSPKSHKENYTILSQLGVQGYHHNFIFLCTFRLETLPLKQWGDFINLKTDKFSPHSKILIESLLNLS
ncbi:hypothetical protein, partial [Vibrio sp. 10N.222.52.B7]|uniref:hypothetical protein n=1 Tax=Vibrio sp. 10N.222.52.B7 TaxID=3229629 RepID=UPI00355159D1